MPSDEISPGQVPLEDRLVGSETASVEVPPGGLYAAYGAVTARAMASAVADRDPRRRAFMRHVVLMSVLFVVAGVALIVAIAMLVS
jgi:hypothetical protein